MEKLQAKTNKKIIFTEFGFKNSDQAVKEPQIESKKGINNLAQAIGYESLFQTFSKKAWFDGVYTWKWYADPYNKDKKNTIDYIPPEKPALAVLKKWYHNL